MAALSRTVKNSLDESRLLVLVVQVLIGFQLQGPFEPGFERLNDVLRLLEVASLILLLTAFILFVSPTPFAEIAYRGDTSTAIQSFTNVVVTMGLLPFASALTLNIYVVVDSFETSRTAPALASIFFAVALWVWYGLGLRHRTRRTAIQIMTHKTALEDRIQDVLVEARVIVPGAQALLGFQFTTFLLAEFERLPVSMKRLHLLSLLLIAFAMILLIAPAAYHRIAENGEDSERVVQFASRMVLTSLVPLGAGIALDVFIVVQQAIGSVLVGLAAAAVMIVGAAIVWLGYPMMRRRRRLAADR